MSEEYNIAVVGATGNVGREILQILEQREFPVNNIYCLASSTVTLLSSGILFTSYSPSYFFASSAFSCFYSS